MEVAQIARAIARRINQQHDYFRRHPIDEDLISFAGLAHDLGHPPFGHNGEDALDERMRGYGGFEGNAQTLRILARIEQKVRSPGSGETFGLNLTFRSLGAILKYDHPIAEVRDTAAGLVKGYYASEAPLVAKVKRAILTGRRSAPLKTIECQIMDVSDDIAYSTYDLEDALRAGFLTTLDLIAVDRDVLRRIAGKVAERIASFSEDDVMDVLLDLLIKHDMFDVAALGLRGTLDLRNPYAIAQVVAHVYRTGVQVGRSGTLRTRFTSALVDEFVKGVDCEASRQPSLSKVRVSDDVLRRIEVLKHFSFEVLIRSPRVRITAYRGKEIVQGIFDALAAPGGDELLPDDFRDLHASAGSEAERRRIVCDFVAGMTDRYAIEFYGRLKSENPQTIFKPL